VVKLWTTIIEGDS